MGLSIVAAKVGQGGGTGCHPLSFKPESAAFPVPRLGAGHGNEVLCAWRSQVTCSRARVWRVCRGRWLPVQVRGLLGAAARERCPSRVWGSRGGEGASFLLKTRGSQVELACRRTRV